jgi:DNA-binding XRE family transcriptional regulator
MGGMSYVGIQAKRHRIRYGLSQREVAERAGVSTHTYLRIEKGYVEPYLATVVAIARALDVTVDDLLGFAHQPGKNPPPRLSA